MTFRNNNRILRDKKMYTVSKTVYNVVFWVVSNYLQALVHVFFNLPVRWKKEDGKTFTSVHNYYFAPIQDIIYTYDGTAGYTHPLESWMPGCRSHRYLHKNAALGKLGLSTYMMERRASNPTSEKDTEATGKPLFFLVPAGFGRHGKASLFWSRPICPLSTMWPFATITRDKVLIISCLKQSIITWFSELVTSHK